MITLDVHGRLGTTRQILLDDDMRHLKTFSGWKIKSRGIDSRMEMTVYRRAVNENGRFYDRDLLEDVFEKSDPLKPGEQYEQVNKANWNDYRRSNWVRVSPLGKKSLANRMNEHLLRTTDRDRVMNEVFGRWNNLTETQKDNVFQSYKRSGLTAKEFGLRLREGMILSRARRLLDSLPYCNDE